MTGRLLCGAVLAVALAASRPGAAAGLYFSDRGVRPMGRAGAFVAGADDLGATWYNPAGLTEAGSSLLLDASWLYVQSTYDQSYAVTTADGVQTVINQPTSAYSTHTNGSTPFFPLPTIAGSKAFGAGKRFVIAGGMYIPYLALLEYPDTTDSKPSPGRYALGSFLHGTIGVQPSAWFAVRVTPKLSIGFGMQLLIASLTTTVRVSLCPQDRISCAPEQPEYDAVAQVEAGWFAAVSGNAGIIYIPIPALRLGLSVQAPMSIDTPFTFRARLPDNALFDSAQIQGNSGHIHLVLPPILRAGIEGRYRNLRLELTWVHEFWSIQQSVDIIADDIRITGLKGGPGEVRIPNVSVPRGFVDSDSIRLGGEASFQLFKHEFLVRAGASFETSAVPTPKVSLLALDFVKWVVSIGGSVYATPHLRLDVVYAHTFCQTITVDPYQAQVTHINPFPGNATPEPTNGGTYSATGDLLGVGATYRF